MSHEVLITRGQSIFDFFANPCNIIFGDEGTILSELVIQHVDPMGSFLFASATRDLMLHAVSSYKER